jgi:hypothetical protein
MNSQTTADTPRTALGIQLSEWKVIVLASLGGALEFYDFVIYSMFAQYIAAAYFPADDPLTSLMRSFMVFAAGYLIRPIGGVVLSHFGDRYGRRPVFIAAIFVMSAATAGMGVIPTYASWGASATLLLVLLRLIQGFCLGGELPGAITYVVETSPRRAGFAAGFIFFCVNSGVLIAALISLGVHALLSEAAVADWGWRIGFLAGGALGLFSFYLRRSLEETKEFSKIRHAAARRPFVEVLRDYPVQIGVGVAALTATAGFNGLLFAMPSFLPGVMGYSSLEAIVAQNVCLAILSVGLLTAAWAGDKIPRRWILGFGALMAVLLSFPFFRAAAEHSINLIVLFAFAGVVASFYNGAMCGVVGDLFVTRIRFSGVALSFNLAFSVFSGIAPLVATALVKATGSATGPAYYMTGCALLTLLSSLVLKRYDGRILGELAERERVTAAAPEPALSAAQAD